MSTRKRPPVSCSLPFFQTTSGVGEPNTWHVKLMVWPSAANCSTFGGSTIIGGSAEKKKTQVHFYDLYIFVVFKQKSWKRGWVWVGCGGMLVGAGGKTQTMNYKSIITTSIISKAQFTLSNSNHPLRETESWTAEKKQKMNPLVCRQIML